MTPFHLISYIDAHGGIARLEVLRDSHPSLRLPGPPRINEATVVAPDAETAYVYLMTAMLQDPVASSEFWRRVRAIPRIRIAALRRFGLRGVAPILAREGAVS